MVEIPDFDLEARLDARAAAEILADPEVRRLGRRAWFSEKALHELEDKMRTMFDLRRPVGESIDE